MIQIQDTPDWPTEPDQPSENLQNMALESSFQMATYSLSQLEVLAFPSRAVIDNQADAQAHVFGHWKNFKLHFLVFQNLDAKPYSRTISLLKRMHSLLGPNVSLPVKSGILKELESKAKHPAASVAGLPFANFYLSMLVREIKAGNC